MNKILVLGNESFFEEIKKVSSQANLSTEHACNQNELLNCIEKDNINVVILDDSFYQKLTETGKKDIVKIIKSNNKYFIIVSTQTNSRAIMKAKECGASDFVSKPYNYREFIARLNAVINKKTRITCIGGGTGLFTLLLGLKTLMDVHLTSIVSMSDDGGSSGKLRASFGVLPPGDIRRSLVALSNAPKLMNDVMQYRFQRGDELSGHSLGNLFLTALTEINGSMSEAVRNLGDILNIQGIVLPITNTQTTLCAEFEDGTSIKGESKIDLAEERKPELHITNIWHEPKTCLGVDAYSALINSDIIIIGPGDLFTSIITNLLVDDFNEAVSKSKAKKVYICNLMTKPGETAGFNAYQHVREVVKYFGSDFLDYIIISNTKLSEVALLEYSKKKQEPVQCDNADKIHELTEAQIVLADVGHETNLVRHNSNKITKEIFSIMNNCNA